MRKVFFLFIISLFALQSCAINSEIIYHKDAVSTAIMDIDMREFIKEMKTITPDSLQKEEELAKMDKLPTTWTSIYELEKQEGKLKTTNPDSIKIMKKIFMKSKKENNEPAGFALKLDRFTQSEYLSLNSFTKQEKLPIDQNIYNQWDGKTLIIDTENFNVKSIEKALESANPPIGSSEESKSEMEGMIMMFFKKIGTTLKFENKIKSISGKHDWVRQIDDHSVRIEYDLKAMLDKSIKLKNGDKKITIVTE